MGTTERGPVCVQLTEASWGPVRGPGRRRWQLEPGSSSEDERHRVKRLVGGKLMALLSSVI